MTKRSTPVTIYDIAREAGVSVGSVSRALNNMPDVTPDIRERIKAAASSLGYIRLRKRSRKKDHLDQPRRPSRNIGLVCFGMDDTLVELPVVSAAMHGIEEAVSHSGGSLLFANIPKGDRIPAFLANNIVSGVILKGPNQGLLPAESDCELLAHVQRLPHIWMMGQLANATGDHCNFDADRVGRLAAQHLHEMGHTRVGFLNPKPGHAQFEVIKRGFREEAHVFGLTVEIYELEDHSDKQWPLPGRSSPQVVHKLTEAWFAQPKNKRPTAILVGADTIAVEVYSAAAKLGIKIGKDLGVVSCNNERGLIMGLHPTLTTIDASAAVVGRNAFERLEYRIANPEVEEQVHILVQPTLIVGESVPRLAS